MPNKLPHLETPRDLATDIADEFSLCGVEKDLWVDEVEDRIRQAVANEHRLEPVVAR